MRWLGWLALLLTLVLVQAAARWLFLLVLTWFARAGAPDGAWAAGWPMVARATAPLALAVALPAAFLVWLPLRRRRSAYARRVFRAEALHDRAAAALDRHHDDLLVWRRPADARWQAAARRAAADMEAAARLMCDLGPAPPGAERLDELSKRIGAAWLAILHDYRTAIERGDAQTISACHKQYADLGPLYDRFNREVGRLW